MLGAIIGDIVGSPYEFDMGNKTKDFGPLFTERTHYTDDSVLTVAVADALINEGPTADIDTIRQAVAESLMTWARKYPRGDYGARFQNWITSRTPRPYHSWGNGSAMRVSSVGWLYGSLDRTQNVARATAEVTHNHPEGIKGAEATASAIFMARKGYSKDDIKSYISKKYDYNLSRSLDEIRPYYHHIESCQETVPEAIIAFIEGNSFEDVIRNAVSLGGDSDTLTCIAGSIAEAKYGVPEEFRIECESRIPGEFVDVIDRFRRYIK